VSWLCDIGISGQTEVFLSPFFYTSGAVVSVQPSSAATYKIDAKGLLLITGLQNVLISLTVK
jgi:hypothetical protein